MKKVLFLIAVIALTGCITQKRCEQMFPHRDSVSVQYLTRDSTVFVSDSASYMMYLGCYDAYGKLTDDNVRLMGEITTLKSNVVKPVVQIKDRFIKVDCVVDSLRVYLKWKERYTSEVKTVTVEVNKVTWWQKTQIWMGRILMVLIVAAGVYVTLKLAKKV